MMSDAVLVLNAGSSSIKFGLFDISGTEPRLLYKGLLDEDEAKPSFTVTDAAGNHLFEKRLAPVDDNGEALLADVLNWSNDYLTGGTLAAIGIASFTADVISTVQPKSPTRPSTRWPP